MRIIVTTLLLCLVSSLYAQIYPNLNFQHSQPQLHNSKMSIGLSYQFAEYSHYIPDVRVTPLGIHENEFQVNYNDIVLSGEAELLPFMSVQAWIPFHIGRQIGTKSKPFPYYYLPERMSSGMEATIGNPGFGLQFHLEEFWSKGPNSEHWLDLSIAYEVEADRDIESMRDDKYTTGPYIVYWGESPTFYYALDYRYTPNNWQFQFNMSLRHSNIANFFIDDVGSYLAVRAYRVFPNGSNNWQLFAGLSWEYAFVDRYSVLREAEYDHEMYIQFGFGHSWSSIGLNFTAGLPIARYDLLANPPTEPIWGERFNLGIQLTHSIN